MTDQSDWLLAALPRRVELRAVEWPEITVVHDLARLLVETAELRDGDIAVVTSKVVSKAEGRLLRSDRPSAVEAETVRVVARRALSVIAETRQGFVMAAAGVDASNTTPGTVVLLPVDPDESARNIRDRIRVITGLNVGVVVTDTIGRAWRNGQTDQAIGCAGLDVMVELRGSHDTHGNELVVSAPAIADEIAGAADLVKGKASGCPVAVVTGLDRLVLPAGEHGDGAAALIRDSSLDLFGLGSREAAVAAALRSDPVALAHFPPLVDADLVPFEGLTSSHQQVRVQVAAGAADDQRQRTWQVRVGVTTSASPAAYLHAGAVLERAKVIAAAYRLVVRQDTESWWAGHEEASSWQGVAVLTCSAT